VENKIKKSDIFRSKVLAQPENKLFRFSLGQALYDEGNMEAAVPELQFCADSRDDWMLPHILLGKALIEIGRRTEAKNILKTALKLAITQNHEGPEDELRCILADL
jgi:Flp pilus assembly protein TadD